MDSYMGTCDPISSLSFGDLFVASGPNSTIRMVNADEFFHADAKYIQYVGTVNNHFFQVCCLTTST